MEVAPEVALDDQRGESARQCRLDLAPVLPKTGADTSSLVMPGLAMIAAGAALLLASARSMARRRRMI